MFGSTENTPGVRSVGLSSKAKDSVTSSTPLNFSSALEQKHQKLDKQKRATAKYTRRNIEYLHELERINKEKKELRQQI